MNTREIVLILAAAIAVSGQYASGQASQVVSSQMAAGEAHATPPAASAESAVPSLIRYAGVALGNDGIAKPGEANVTFLIFKDEKGGDPLWSETQPVTADAEGRFNVQLGATFATGLPADLFSTGEARWLEVQVTDGAPQPRTLLTSVPYAMKAASADALAGHAAAEFVTRGELDKVAAMATRAEQTARPQASSNLSGSGTADVVPLWTGSTTLGNANIYQSGGKIGINYAAPAATLEVGGGITVHGTMAFPPGVPATSSHSSSSQSFTFSASAWNSATAAPQSSTYTMLAGPTGNNTASPNAIFYFQYQNGASAAINMFTLNGKGLLQLPNSGGGLLSNGNVSLATATQATATAGSNSPMLEIGASSYSSSASAARAETFAWQTLAGGNDTATPTGSLALLFGGSGSTPAATGLSIAANGQITFASGQTFPVTGTGGGTITGVTAGTGLTGGGTKGAITLAIDATKIPTLTGSPTFNGSAGTGAVGETSGTASATAGVEGIAGSGNTSGFSGIAGVWGNSSTHLGVYGTSDAGQGVLGQSNTSIGVEGTSTSYYGMYGSSSSGSGVVGQSSGSTLNTAGVLGLSGSGSGIGHVVVGVWGDSYYNAGVEGTSSQSVGVYGQSSVTSGVQGVSSSGNGVNGSSQSSFGVYGGSNSGTGAGGYTGGGTLNTAGVEGVAGGNNTSGFTGIAGVWGDASAHVGVWGSSDQYSGVNGQSNSGPGVSGTSNSSFGGQFTASSNAAAVYAVNNGSTPGAALFGQASGTDSDGLFAETTGAGGTGVAGYGGAGSDSNNQQSVGVYGYGYGYGVYGYSTNNYGVYGYGNGTGIFGQAGSVVEEFGFAGIQGNSYDADGGFFLSDEAYGLEATSYEGIGVQGYSHAQSAGAFQNSDAQHPTLLAYNAGAEDAAATHLFSTFEAASSSGACGFSHKGDLTCTGQVKSLATTGGGAKTVETYSMQSPENWMEDFGSGELHRGVAVIHIDAAFAETVTASADYHVFITPNGDSKGLYVIAKTPTSFEVRESGGGVSSLTFDYRIVAKRRGMEQQRMRDVTAEVKENREKMETQARAETTRRHLKEDQAVAERQPPPAPRPRPSNK